MVKDPDHELGALLLVGGEGVRSTLLRGRPAQDRTYDPRHRDTGGHRGHGDTKYTGDTGDTGEAADAGDTGEIIKNIRTFKVLPEHSRCIGEASWSLPVTPSNSQSHQGSSLI